MGCELLMLLLVILIKQAEELVAALAASNGNPAQSENDEVRNKPMIITSVLNQ